MANLLNPFIDNELNEVISRTAAVTLDCNALESESECSSSPSTSASIDLSASDWDSERYSSQSDGETSAMEVDAINKVPVSKPVATAKHELSATESDSGSSSETGTHRKTHKAPRTGTSKSARASLKIRDAQRAGTFQVDVAKLDAWKAFLRGTDSRVEFDQKDIRRARHSECGIWVLVKEPYDKTRWNQHLKTCKGKGKAARTPSLLGFFSAGKNNETGRAHRSQDSLRTRPCPGLSEADDSCILKYLSRSPVTGAGAPSIHVLSQTLFNLPFNDLTKQQKKDIYDQQMHEQTWRNEHDKLREM